MQKINLPLHSILFSALCTQAFSQDTSSKEPPISSLQITAKHIEGKGIGYTEGYSTLAGFFAPSPWITGNWIPFIDIRGHIFNSGRPAANAGGGVRYLSKRAWGLNTYYDFRQTNHKNYNQVSVGLESLGEKWDFRINGYLPIFGKQSAPYDIKFGYFSGHSMILSRKKEFALKSIQAEAATHTLKIRHTAAYLAAGPYYLAGSGEAAWGGKARLAFNFFSYFTAEAIASYDTLFRGVYQGRISLNIPLGSKKTVPYSKKEKQRLQYIHQSVDRNEIIPTDKAHFNTPAINPKTQEPYVFWFVDNTSHSNGTYESPYPLLAQAELKAQEYDVIYVFPGDKTDLNLDTGFIMKKDQRLFGSGISHILPTQQKNYILNVKIPKMTDTSPLITLANSPESARGVIALADYCEVAGIHVTSTSDFSGKKIAAILGGPPIASLPTSIGVKNASIHDNLIEGLYYSAGIYLHSSKKSTYVADNTLKDVTAFNAILCLNDVSNIALSTNIIDNIITKASGTGIYFQNAPGMNVSEQNILISNNQISDCSRDGISILNTGEGLFSNIQKQDIQILDNTVLNSGDNGIVILNNIDVSIGTQTSTIESNLVTNCINGRGIYLFNHGTDVHINNQKIEISNNVINESKFEGIYVINYDDLTIETQNTLISHNIVNKSSIGVSFSNNLTVLSQNQSAVIKHNTINDSTEGGIYLQNQGPSISNPLCLDIKENFINASAAYGINLASFSASSTNASFYENTTTATKSNISLGLTSNNTSTLCGNIRENTLDKNIVFIEQNTSQIFVAPLIDNIYVDIIGPYTPVPAGTCDCVIDSDSD